MTQCEESRTMNSNKQHGNSYLTTLDIGPEIRWESIRFIPER